MGTDRPEGGIASSKRLTVEPFPYPALKSEFPMVGQALFESNVTNMRSDSLVCKHFRFMVTHFTVSKELIGSRIVAEPEGCVGCKGVESLGCDAGLAPFWIDRKNKSLRLDREGGPS